MLKLYALKAVKDYIIIAKFYRLGMEPKHLLLLFRTFIQSIIMYCAPIFMQHVSAQNKTSISRIFSIATRFGVNAEFLIQYEQIFKEYVLRSYLNPEHFLHHHIESMPSGRLRSVKFRTTKGKNCFLKNAVNLINDVIF